LGRADEDITEIESAFASYKATGATIPVWAYSCLAFAYLAAQRAAEALGITAKGLELADKTGDREALSELHRLRGELVLLGDSTATTEATASLNAAVDTAREQDAKLPELRATVSLARLLATQGKRDEARAMLAEIYNWFTEGFDTADLKAAKALLEELS
jgi:predicted ATPase